MSDQLRKGFESDYGYDVLGKDECFPKWLVRVVVALLIVTLAVLIAGQVQYLFLTQMLMTNLAA